MPFSFATMLANAADSQLIPRGTPAADDDDDIPQLLPRAAPVPPVPLAPPPLALPTFAAALPPPPPRTPASASSATASSFVIAVPPKLWRPKPADHYIPMDYSNDIDESVFLFEQHGRAICHPPTPFSNIRTDIHQWDHDRDIAEFTKNFVVGPTIDPAVRSSIVSIIQAHWDCFYSAGVRFPILYFEFAIDTGASPPVCCKKPHYGPHESKIIMEHVNVLLSNGWIRECYGPWGSSIVLAAKPHQEHILDIQDFVWRMCVSYRRLNQVTLPFEYPIPRCDDAIDNFGDSNGRLYFIALDNKTGYHQIAVRFSDQEKLAFFAPNDKKYCFGVMPFGPRNAPAFYTCMMHLFKGEWTELFRSRHPTDTSHLGDRIIIDDILLWSTLIASLLLLFECVCDVFSKYRVTFQLKKCEFLTDRIEYVGHDITSDGNCPAQSKFDLITDWPLPCTGSSLASFIGLLTFYNIYCPFFEIRVKPLRLLERQHHRKPIPPALWTPPLTSLWNELKIGITSSPCLARYDSSKPCFLKTDWSGLGMGWILMQPDDSDASKVALALLRSDGICDFDLSMNGARLRPIRFGSRSCTERECHFHSFVGEAGCGRWAISQNRKFLWGSEFFWLCDCAAVKEILEYDGPIHQIRRWAQELLGYFFQVFHRPARMMRDVDGLTRRFDHPLVTQHLTLAFQLYTADRAARPAAYDPTVFHTHNPLKCISHVSSVVPMSLPSPIPLAESFPMQATLSNLPLRFRPLRGLPLDDPSIEPSSTTCTGSHVLLSHRTIAWFSLTPQLGAIPFALGTHSHLFPVASLIFQPTSFLATPLCHAALPDSFFAPYSVEQLCRHLLLSRTPAIFDSTSLDPTLNWFLDRYPRITGIDCSCPFTAIPAQLEWLTHTLSVIDLLHSHYALSCFFLFVHLPADLDCGVHLSDAALRWRHSPWQLHMGPTTSALYGDAVHSRRWICLGLRQVGLFPTPVPSFPSPILASSCLGDHVLPDLNQVNDTCIPLPAIISSISSDLSLPITNPHPIATLQAASPPASLSDFFVLDPDFPASEPAPSPNYIPHRFSATFGLPFTSSFGTNFVRPFTVPEIFACYSAPPAILALLSPATSPSDYSSVLSTCCPFQLGSSLIDHLIDIHLFTSIDTANSPTEFVTRSFVTTSSSAARPVPSPLNWLSAYHQDPDTKLLFDRLSSSSPFTKPDLSAVHSAYCDYIRRDRISIVEGKLVVFQPVQNNQEMLMLIVVPLSLRRDIFSAYHASPSAGHMGIYKTLHRVRLRFFWPQCRKDVTNWVLQCPHCIAVNGTVARNSELIFSWPLCCPFYILHVDLWAPGDIANYRGDTYLLNTMCDLTGFVLVNATNNITAHDLARLFVQEVLLKIGFCGLVVVDDGSNFKGLFVAVCDILSIDIHVAARGNHKAVGVERFHRFLNKAVAIASNDRGTNTVFVEAAHTAAYAWNSSPIDGTDIIRSVPAVGRPFRFPFDLSLAPTPTPTSNQASDVHAFLRLAGPTAQFAEQVLRLLTEERRAIHRERANASRSTIAFAVGDLVMARVQVNSDASTGTVAKLSYRKRGPYEIIEATGYGAYFVRRYGSPTAPLLKYPTQALSPLPPALFPCHPVDTPDFRYLNHSESPLPHPLKSPFNIQMYNNMWFPSSLATDHPPLFQFTDVLDDDATAPTTLPFPIPVASIPAAAAIPVLPSDPLLVLPPPTTGASLFAAITASHDRLFLVSYRPAGTLRPRWYLVQVDLPQSLLDPASLACATDGRYYCHFLGKHPDDASLPDPPSRWWLLWHRFSTAADGSIDFGSRVLFNPATTPDPASYIAWADILPLLDPAVCLFGPLSFASPSANPPGRTSSFRQLLPFPSWAALTDICISRGILPPVLSTPPTARSRWTRTSRAFPPSS
jgi:hypothetical protein